MLIFILQKQNDVLNGVFGSKPNTEIMKRWRFLALQKLDQTEGKINWTGIGGNILNDIFWDKHRYLYDNYTIFNGADNMYPVYWTKCVAEFIHKPYENYKNIEKEYQPLIILVNSVYRTLANQTEAEILQGNSPISYFLNKSMIS